MKSLLLIVFSGLAYAQTPVEVLLGPPASTVTPPSGCVVTSQSGNTVNLTCTTATPGKCVYTVSPAAVTATCTLPDGTAMFSPLSIPPANVGDGVIVMGATRSGYGSGLQVSRKVGTANVYTVVVSRSVPGPSGQPGVTSTVWQGDVTVP